MQENWKQHKSGYWISDLGNVKCKRLTRDGYRIMKFGKNHKGYFHVNINQKSTFVHKLVVETFISDIPYKMQINHKDGVKTNNKLENLEIVTASQNRQHAFDNKLQFGAYGEKSWSAIYKESDILNVYRLIKNNLSNRQIADITNIRIAYVNQLRKGEKWKYLYKQNF